VLIEPRRLLFIASEVGPLRREGRMSSAQRRLVAEHEAAHGRRPSHSGAAVRAVLARPRGTASTRPPGGSCRLPIAPETPPGCLHRPRAFSKKKGGPEGPP